MAARTSKYKSALTHFKRVAGQYKRYVPTLDPQKYLQQVKTARGVERAFRKMQFDYEQQRIAERVYKYEERQYEQYKESLEKELRDKSEQAAKDADLKARKDAFKQSYDTFQKLYDYKLTKADFRELIDVWGGISSDIKSAYGGSDPQESGYGNLVYGYKEIKDPMQRANFPDVLKKIYNEAPEGATQESLMDQVYKWVEESNKAYDERMEKEKNKA